MLMNSSFGGGTRLASGMVLKMAGAAGQAAGKRRTRVWERPDLSVQLLGFRQQCFQLNFSPDVIQLIPEVKTN